MITELIEIKDKHIKEGKRSCYDKCPTALAFIDAGYTDADVTYIHIAVRKNGVVYAGAVSNQLRAWIDMFDMGSQMLPYSFQIDLERV